MGNSTPDTRSGPAQIRSVHESFSGILQQYGFDPDSRFLIAFSGGLDSSVLLDAVNDYSSDPGTLIRVIYIHHGLSDAADQWDCHCRQACLQYGVDYQSIRINLENTSGSLEAEARRQRYSAILAHMGDDETLLFAHHRDDNVETFLLNLLRGAGVRGLSGIPVLSEREGKKMFRPLSGFSRQLLFEYANQRGLNWCEDDSNQDIRFDRNYLRHQIVPVFEARWPSTDKAIARAASNLSDASALLDEIAAEDLHRLSVEDFRPTAVHQLKLPLNALNNLTPLRKKNLLQYSFRQLALYSPDQNFLQSLMELTASGETSKHLTYEKWSIHLHDGFVYFYHEACAKQSVETVSWNPVKMSRIEWGPYIIRAENPGPPLDVEVWINPRHGGEKIYLTGRSHHHSLKKWLQEKRIPPWERALIPLIFQDTKIAAIPGLLQPSDLAIDGPLSGIKFFLC